MTDTASFKIIADHLASIAEDCSEPGTREKLFTFAKELAELAAPDQDVALDEDMGRAELPPHWRRDH
jgi:hypothetical protein